MAILPAASMQVSLGPLSDDASGESSAAADPVDAGLSRKSPLSMVLAGPRTRLAQARHGAAVASDADAAVLNGTDESVTDNADAAAADQLATIRVNVSSMSSVATSNETTSDATTSDGTISNATTSEATKSGATTSEATTSGATTSEATTSNESMNGATTSNETRGDVTTSNESMSGAVTSGVAMSSATTSDANTSNESMSNETTSNETTSGVTTSNETTSNESMSNETTSGVTTSNETTSNESMSNETTSNETTSGVTTSNETTSNESMSNATTSGVAMSNETTNNESMSNETTSGVTTSGVTSSNETTSNATTSNATVCDATMSGVGTSDVSTSGVSITGVNDATMTGVSTSGVNSPTCVETEAEATGMNVALPLSSETVAASGAATVAAVRGGEVALTGAESVAPSCSGDATTSSMDEAAPGNTEATGCRGAEKASSSATAVRRRTKEGDSDDAEAAAPEGVVPADPSGRERACVSPTHEPAGHAVLHDADASRIVIDVDAEEAKSESDVHDATGQDNDDGGDGFVEVDRDGIPVGSKRTLDSESDEDAIRPPRRRLRQAINNDDGSESDGSMAANEANRPVAEPVQFDQEGVAMANRRVMRASALAAAEKIKESAEHRNYIAELRRRWGAARRQVAARCGEGVNEDGEDNNYVEALLDRLVDRKEVDGRVYYKAQWVPETDEAEVQYTWEPVVNLDGHGDWMEIVDLWIAAKQTDDISFSTFIKRNARAIRVGAGEEMKCLFFAVEAASRLLGLGCFDVTDVAKTLEDKGWDFAGGVRHKYVSQLIDAFRFAGFDIDKTVWDQNLFKTEFNRTGSNVEALSFCMENQHPPAGSPPSVFMVQTMDRRHIAHCIVITLAHDETMMVYDNGERSYFDATQPLDDIMWVRRCVKFVKKPRARKLHKPKSGSQKKSHSKKHSGSKKRSGSKKV